MNSTLSKTQPIHCKWVKGAFLTDLSACTYKENLAVFSIRMTDFKGQISEFRNILSPDELMKSVNFVMEKDSDRFILSRAVLRILLGRYTGKSAVDIEFGSAFNLKPELKTNTGSVHFNVTHSGELILIAVSSKPVGIDTEMLDDDFACNQVAVISFSDEEQKYISSSHNPSEAFFLLWTRKEALLKGTGKGIDDSLPKISVLNGMQHLDGELLYTSEPWTIGSFGIGHDYVASIAFHPALENGLLPVYRVDNSILSI